MTPQYHVYHFTFMLIPHYIIYLFGLHIYCMWVVKFSLRHKERSKHILCIKCGNLKLHMWGMSWHMLMGCAQHWWPFLCGISSLGFPHSTCRNHGYKNVCILKCTFHALLCQWKVPSQLWMPRDNVHVWHIVLQWQIICGHNVANGRRVHVSASLWCTLTAPKPVQEING